jgi:hypothetical protein
MPAIALSVYALAYAARKESRSKAAAAAPPTRTSSLPRLADLCLEERFLSAFSNIIASRREDGNEQTNLVGDAGDCADPRTGAVDSAETERDRAQLQAVSTAIRCTSVGTESCEERFLSAFSNIIASRREDGNEQTNLVGDAGD